MSEREHDCELHDWQTIGMVTTDTASLVIADPGASATLARAWHERVGRMRDPDCPGCLTPGCKCEPMHNFEELKLTGDAELSHPWVEARGTEHALVLDTGGDGGWHVDARFCDYYGDGHLSVCEVRIRLHGHDEDDPDREATGWSPPPGPLAG